MTVAQLAPGIWRIPTTARDRDNAFLVETEEGYTLVDVGWAKAPGRIAAAVEELGHKPADIRRIVITHAHPDHVQGAEEMRARTGAEILIHEADADWLRSGRVPAAGREGSLGRLVDKIPKLHWRPTEPDRTVADDEVVDGLKVIHTPGHSPGHVVLLHEPSRTLLAGDAVFHRSGEPQQGPAALSADSAARDASLRRLPADVAAVGFAHGRPLTGDGIQSYVDWLRENGSVRGRG
jgi:glyoxylase-like metal-dependent hydrolase (beta-lactamase superfamily II)